MSNNLRARQGLSVAAAQEILSRVGPNTIGGHEGPNWLKEFLREFKDLLVVILLCAALVAYFLGEKTDGTLIIGIVFLNACIGFFQKFRAEKAIAALQKLVAPHATVIRDGIKQVISAERVVPGDWLYLSEGDTVAADGQIMEISSLHTQEAVLSGESLPVEKTLYTTVKALDEENRKRGQVYLGTQVSGGNALVLITATGAGTLFGKIAHLTGKTEKDITPLQKELANIGRFVGKITLLISGILILSSLWQGQAFVEALLFAVSVAVAAVPEGLPTTITIALALGVQKLARQKAIVKTLSSAETLGATTVICSDKTGTLTQNQMTVKEIAGADFSLSVDGDGYDPIGTISVREGEKTPHFDERLKLLFRVFRLCNNSALKKTAGLWTAIGDPTEAALLVAARKSTFSDEKNSRRLQEIPFSSERKLMSTFDEVDGATYLHSKGAVEKILERCSLFYYKGQLRKLETNDKKRLLTINENLAKRAMRVLACAYKEIPRSNSSAKPQEKDLIFLGLAAMIDPPRAGVKEAIALTKQAGVKTYMVTGDYSLTALAIAEKIGLIKSRNDTNVITGTALQNMSTDQLKKLLKSDKECIFCRVSPEDKLKIVSTLKKMNAVVAVTGDGVNDAPALKRADIGISMGIAGTEVSKEAANLVLADDSFTTIVAAIKTGRTIYANMKKFIYYIFSANIGELVTIFLAIILGFPMPLTAVLILLVNLGTDVFPALALSLEPNEPDIMNKPPRSVKTRILSLPFILNFSLIGLYIGTAVTGGYLFILLRGGWRFNDGQAVNSDLHVKAATFAFALLVLIQMFHAFNSRSLTHSIFKLGILNNRWLWGAVLASLVLTLAVTEIMQLQQFFRTTSLSGTEWLILIPLAASVLLVEEIKKYFVRHAVRI